MSLDPIVAAMLDALPPSPSIRSVDVAQYREQIKAVAAHAPRYDVPLASVEDRTIEADGTGLAVRVYTPVGKGPFPLLVYYHGGGFTIGDLDTSDSTCRAIASGAGCVVLSVDYRLAPEHPYPVPNDDCWAALRWAHKEALALGADPARIAVGGDSAGSTLASSVALRARNAGLPLVAQLLICGVQSFETEGPSYEAYPDAPLITVDDIHFYYEQYLPEGVDRKNPDLAPLYAENLAGLPPAFVMTAEIDPSRSSSDAYADALKQAGVPVLARCYAGMPHGFYSMAAFVPTARQALDDVCEWLKQQFAQDK